MQLEQQRLSLTDYRAFCEAHEERLFELIDGLLVEKAVTSFLPSKIAMRVGQILLNYLDQNPIGAVTGADGTYEMDASNAFIPDVSYISHARLPQDVARAVPVPPDLAVEVKSPTGKVQSLRRKAARYLELGTRQVWLIYPDERLVEVYTADGDVRLLTGDAILDGGDLLPGFQVGIARLWA